MRNTTLTEKRNEKIKVRYNKLEKKFPQWRRDALLKELSEEFFLTPETIGQIVAGCYNKKKYKKKQK